MSPAQIRFDSVRTVQPWNLFSATAKRLNLPLGLIITSDNKSFFQKAQIFGKQNDCLKKIKL